MKVFLGKTEDWQDIDDAIKEAEAYLAPLGVSFAHKKLDFDASREEYYDIKTSNSGLKKRLTKSIKGEIVKAVGISHAGANFDYYGLIVDKNKSLETASLQGQHSALHKTIEIYAKKTKKKYFGFSYIAYNIIHEVFHALADYKKIPDNLHKYLDGRPKNLDAYFEYLLNGEKVTIKRLFDTKVQTIGILQYKDFICYTLELTWKDNQKNVSCIPKGTYKCKLTYSPKFKRKTYELLAVPNRSAIRIHSGNYHTQIQGCILLGDTVKDINKDRQIDVLNSVKTIAKFEALMGGKEFDLEIV